MINENQKLTFRFGWIWACKSTPCCFNNFSQCCLLMQWLFSDFTRSPSMVLFKVGVLSSKILGTIKSSWMSTWNFRSGKNLILKSVPESLFQAGKLNWTYRTPIKLRVFHQEMFYFFQMRFSLNIKKVSIYFRILMNPNLWFILYIIYHYYLPVNAWSLPVGQV